MREPAHPPGAPARPADRPMHLFTAHRALIVSASALGVLFAATSAVRFRESGRATALALGAAGLLASIALVAYLRWFLRKTRGRRAG